MANIEVKTGTNPTAERYISARQRAIDALHKKILKHPFYTGRNSVAIGLSTPIEKDRAAQERMVSLRSNPRLSISGLSPEDFYGDQQDEGDKVIEVSTTVEEMHAELEAQSPQEDSFNGLSAEDFYAGSLVVNKGVNGGQVERKDGRIINWSQKENWVEDWEILGEYIGTEINVVDLATKYNSSHDRIVRGIESHISDLEVHKYGRATNRRNFEKPHRFFNRQKELDNPESQISRMLADIEAGMSVVDLRNTYGSQFFRKWTQDLLDAGLRFPTVPYRRWQNNPNK